MSKVKVKTFDGAGAEEVERILNNHLNDGFTIQYNQLHAFQSGIEGMVIFEKVERTSAKEENTHGKVVIETFEEILERAMDKSNKPVVVNVNPEPNKEHWLQKLTED